MQYAGFWIRVLSSLIDAAIITLAAWLFFITSSGATHNFDEVIAFLAESNWTSVINMTYILMFWIFLGSTPGKFVLGLRIVDITTGEKPSVIILILRLLGYIPSALIFNLGFIWIAFDERKQGWHDKLAGTAVVSSW